MEQEKYNVLNAEEKELFQLQEEKRKIALNAMVQERWIVLDVAEVDGYKNCSSIFIKFDK